MSQESEKTNQFCFSYTNYNDSNTTIYNNLISSFENHLLTEAQINAFITYMKGNCDQNFTKDIMYILEDYNSLLYQSIQAIKSLLSENTRLIQNQTLSCLDNKEKKEEEKEEITIKKIKLKRPLREQIKVMAHSKKLNNGLSDRNEEPLKVSALTEDVTKEETNKEEILILKETNEILKQIEVTQSNQSFFVRKYTQNKNIDISVGYKEFLQNIVEYKYELNTLKQIKQDITMKQTSNNYNKKNEKKLNNKHYTESISPYISKKNFTDSLRIYSNQTSKEKPPFVPFTSPYSRLFSSENKG